MPPPPLNPIQVVCPECGVRIRLRDTALIGRKIKCPKCEEVFRVPKPESERESVTEEEESPWEDEMSSSSQPVTRPNKDRRSSLPTKGTGSLKKRGVKKKGGMKLSDFPRWVAAIPVIILIGIGLYFFPPGAIFRTMTRMNPLSDNYYAVSRDFKAATEAYKEFAASLKDDTTDEEMRESLLTFNKRFQALLKRALLVPYKTKEDVASVSGLMRESRSKPSGSNTIPRINSGMKTPKINPGTARRISTIYQNLGEDNPDESFAMVALALEAIPDEPAPAENMIQRATAEYRQLENDAIQTVGGISSESQISDAANSIRAKAKRVSELCTEIETESKSNAASFFKLKYSLVTGGLNRLETMWGLMSKSVGRNEDLQRAIQEYVLAGTQLHQTIIDSHREAGNKTRPSRPVANGSPEAIGNSNPNPLSQGSNKIPGPTGQKKPGVEITEEEKADKNPSGSDEEENPFKPETPAEREAKKKASEPESPFKIEK
ncbi:MAG: hypothetical protein KDA68_08420 [Planctomycetaceae bacterium]|nr:hypothetical protein [Planctomycetaceae bacterium]